VARKVGFNSPGGDSGAQDWNVVDMIKDSYYGKPLSIAESSMLKMALSIPVPKSG